MNPVWEVIKRVAPGLILALLVIGALFGAYRHGVRSTTDKLTTKHTAEMMQIKADLAIELAAAEGNARDAERKHVEALAAIANDFQVKEDHAKAEIDRLDAAVRAGDVRLRQRFTCPAAAGGAASAPGASAAPADAAKGRGLRDEDARALVRMSDEADQVTRQLQALQAIVKKDRGQ